MLFLRFHLAHKQSSVLGVFLQRGQTVQCEEKVAWVTTPIPVIGLMGIFCATHIFDEKCATGKRDDFKRGKKWGEKLGNECNHSQPI